ncbi:5-oxoprolinase subunit PxpB [Ancylobacter amanitiformis]|uniref:KipI family sensor histidine kinase inhibitor n=1 Tax=Ancylobacter amanitiformis TaxID=217069 RepID=A0ABU0LN77_9HYPH|nr:5-oxoprolinase subunit PxpB [Ancylobacter amanitiformis]MDQ0510119.1 KipI family sensor histidine kinase inhibitor [Ancylobacter amanitiformis]
MTEEKAEQHDAGSRRLGALARFLDLGDTAFAVEFGTVIAPEINALVHRTAALLAAHPPEGMVETVPTFRSLLVHYDPRRTCAAALQESLAALDIGEARVEAPARVWRIPVLYGGEAGPDLGDVARATGLGEDEVIARHAGTVYRVYVQGFLPGFAYLGDLPAELDLPRLTSPRVRVPAGSVAIAQRMTGIYPVESPGGWRLIGHTPLRFFDPARAPPTLFTPGDGVRFVPAGPDEHAAIRAAVARGAHVPDCEASR